MNACVIGMGSIGKRHYTNLKDMGIDVIGCDLGDKHSLSVDFAVIATPDELHVPLAMEYLSRDIPVFIEKPLSNNLAHLDMLDEIYINVPTMVACNIRFTSGIELAETMAELVISFHARISDNHPNRDKYGDIVLQDIHEFDYIQHLFGEIDSIQISYNKDKTLYDAIVTCTSGLQGTIHGDRLRDTYERDLLIRTKSKEVSIPIQPSDEMYVKEMEHFIDCILTETIPMNTIREASKLTRKLIESINRCNNTSQSNLLSVSS